MSTSIYTGPWINWNAGPIYGATLTLSRRDGGYLTTFIATFITLVGAQLWYILTFAIHQFRASKGARDGLHHQQQNILRNTTTPAGAAWSFLLQAWYWRGKASRLLLRTLPIALFCAFYILLFAGAAVLSSQISEIPGTVRLLKEGHCGEWRSSVTTATMADILEVESTLGAYEHKIVNLTVLGDAYARACYGDNPSPLSCSIFPKSFLKWNITYNVACPFRGGICIGGQRAALKMTSEKLHSRSDLGINLADDSGVYFRYSTTCSPLSTEHYVKSLKGQDSSDLGYANTTEVMEYNYGALFGKNYTYRYNLDAIYTDIGYTTHARYSFPGATEPWEVNGNLSQRDADLSMVFVASNSIKFLQPYNDPVFGANLAVTDENGKLLWYQTNKYVVPIACTEQQQICNPLNSRCTPFVAHGQISEAIRASRLKLSDTQREVAIRIKNASTFASIYHTVNNRGRSAVLASDLVAGTKQYALPPDQWVRECKGWFTTGLAVLQHALQEYASGPTNLRNGLELVPPNSAIGQSMCTNQIVNDTQDTTSFSILGLVLVLVLGVVIILLSLCLEIVVGWIQSTWKKGGHKRLSWVMDDKLMLQRLVFVAQGIGEWEDGEQWPVVVKGARAFRSWEGDDVQGSGPLIVNDAQEESVAEGKVAANSTAVSV